MPNIAELSSEYQNPTPSKATEFIFVLHPKIGLT